MEGLGLLPWTQERAASLGTCLLWLPPGGEQPSWGQRRCSSRGEGGNSPRLSRGLYQRCQGATRCGYGMEGRLPDGCWEELLFLPQPG